MGTMGLTVSKESLWLIAICLVDTVVTVCLVASGLAYEANPLMAWCIDRGFGFFYLVKMSTVMATVVMAEIYMRRNRQLIRTMLRAGIAAYAVIYCLGVYTVNFV